MKQELTLFEKVKEAIRLSDKVGRSRGSNCYALDKQAVDRMVVLEIRLEAEIKTMLDTKDAEIAALKAERDALKRDAERYRFLRAQPIEGEAGQPVVAMPNGMSSGYYLNEETADFAIDAAMQAQAQPQNDRN